MKRCSICKRKKATNQFNINRCKPDGLQTFCRDCGKRKANRYYKNNGERMREQIAAAKQRRIDAVHSFLLSWLLSHPCVDCGENDPVVLEFDHVKGSKTENVGTLIHDGSLAAVKKEMRKCEVRCANCHRRRTAEQHGSWRLGSVAKR